MMLNGLIAKVVLGTGLALALFLYGVHWGNSYGLAARALARVQAELATTNAQLNRQLAEDAAIAAREAEAEDRAEAEFAKVAPHLEKCPISKSAADALNKIGGG